MATERLITQLMDRLGAHPGTPAVDILHELLDDSRIEEDAAPLGIAETAALVGLSPYALRYYESEGLVSPGRNPSGHREYSAFDLRRLVFLTRMRVSGMPMRELTRYIRLVEQGDASIAERRQMMQDQRARIARQIDELTLALATTDYKIAVYSAPE